MKRNIVSKVGNYEIEKSCGYFYPTFNGNAEFKTLRECQLWLINHHMPLMRFLKAHDKNCIAMLNALVAFVDF